MHEFANQIARRGMHSPADEFLVTEAGERYTYGEFDAVTNRVANGLSDLGGSRGATIGVLMGNTAEHLLTVAGGLRRGCTVVPLNFRGGADEIARQIKHDEIEILAVSAHYRDVLRQIRSDIEVDTILYSGDGDEAGMGISYEAVIEDASTDPMRPLIEPTQTAMIFHTGGTTGVPKSVPWRPGHVEAHAKKLALEAGVTGDDSILIVTPLFHIASSMMGVYMAPFAGARIVLLERFSVEPTLAAVDREEITVALFVPSMVRAMLRKDHLTSAYDLTPLRTILFTGETVGAMIERDTRQIFPSAGIWNVYGATEVGVSLALPATSVCEDNAVGSPFADRDASIRDDDGNQVAQGDYGELWVRGKDTPDGFFKMPEATAERYGNGEAGDWFRTGDIGYVDDQGLYHVVGRLDDRITRGGENIQPAEIENYLLALGSVKEVAAFGVDHDVLGETVAVAIVPADSADLSRETILAYCERRLASYKCPEHVQFREQLPRTDAGKFDRSRLSAEFNRP